MRVGERARVLVTARGLRIATLVAGVVATWGDVAWASGHELNALGDAFQVAAAVVAALPWTISWCLLLRRNSIRTWFWGTLTAGIATVIIIASELSSVSGGSPQAIFVLVALLPAVAHLIKRVRAEVRAERAGDAGGGDEKVGPG